ncbi:MAG: hypothetical protein AB8C46_13580 [Burkholderiaceae bacterium]
MAALAILRRVDTARGLSIKQVSAAFARQSFKAPQVRRIGESTVCWFDSLHSSSQSPNWVEFETGFICCVGELAYQRKRGRAALTALWHDYEKPGVSVPDDLYGNFHVVIQNASGAWMFGDDLGLLQLFSSHDGQLLSTSWMSCLLLEPHRLLDRLATQDYILNGASHGTSSIVSGITRVPTNYRLELATGVMEHADQRSWINQYEFASQAAAIDLVSATLIDRTSRCLGGDPAGLVTALSGGYDSRLILAALNATQCPADLFVYGKPNDEDVLIAQDLGRALGEPVNVLDKSSIDSNQPELGLAQVEANALFFDGTPIDGLFDPGSDRLTRIRHAESAKLQLNGGGGEVFRNFFYLGSRSFSATELVRCFYHQFTRDVFPNRTSYDDYIDSTAANIARAVQNTSGVLSRTEVEAVYPLFRVRDWTSRTNSIVARYGRYYTPLVDPILVRQALALPMHWKNFGRFEGQLINTLSPTLGSRPLSYGFTPASGPDLTYQIKMTLQHARTPSLRGLTPSIKRALGRSGSTDRPQAPGWLQTAEPIDEIVRIENIRSEPQLKRAFSVMALMKVFGLTLR